MDKKSIIGLLIIGAILLTFSIFNSSQQTVQDESSKTEKKENPQENKTEVTKQPELATSLVPKLDKDGNHVMDSMNRFVYHDTLTNRDTAIAPVVETKIAPVDSNAIKQGSTPKMPEKLARIENDLLIIE
ncbi:MAG: hypothetical protein JNJ99_02920, partial [Crocinitomicaceae bacterium]|nr:hypothetical protein [Crocinitomicaceae bacterium]